MGPNSKILFSFIFLKESTFFKVVKHDKNPNIVCVWVQQIIAVSHIILCPAIYVVKHNLEIHVHVIATRLGESWNHQLNLRLTIFYKK